MGAVPEGTIAVKTFSRNRIEFDKEIGSGSFGKVYKATVKDTGATVAVKVFFQDFIGLLPNVDSKIRANAYDELAKVAVLDHENIVRLLGMVEDEIPWLIFEYMRDGNLLEYVMRKRELKEKTLIRFCRDICNGMAFIHRNNFLHKDLAARNILLDGKTAKIADMGLCSFLTEDHDGSYALGGKLFPYRHAGAECIVECIFTFESDVWSFGVLMFEIFTHGATPYGKENKQPEVRRFIADGLSPMDFQEPICSEDIRFIMKSIFSPKREARPSFVELFKHFDALIHGHSIRIPRPQRDASPFRGQNHHLQMQQRHLQDSSISSSQEILSSSPNHRPHHFLNIPDKKLSQSNGNFSSNPDIHASLGQNGSTLSGTSSVSRSRAQLIRQEDKSTKNYLSFSPPSSVNERRYSATPELLSSSPSTRQDWLTVNSIGGKSPRRTASFNNVSKPEKYDQQQQQHVDQNLLKDYVPNRFGNKKF